jgi:hypothetical protein
MAGDGQGRERGVSRRQVVKAGAKLAYVTPAVIAVASAVRTSPAFSLSSPNESTPEAKAGSSPVQKPVPVTGAAPAKPEVPAAPPPAPEPPEAPPAVKSEAPPTLPSPLPRLPNTGTGGRAHLMPPDPLQPAAD